jgi:hypothetical protein
MDAGALVGVKSHIRHVKDIQVVKYEGPSGCCN